MNTNTIICPNCGAVTTNHEICEFCGSVIVQSKENSVRKEEAREIQKRDKYTEIKASDYPEIFDEIKKNINPIVLSKLKEHLKLQEKNPYKEVKMSMRHSSWRKEVSNILRFTETGTEYYEPGLLLTWSDERNFEELERFKKSKIFPLFTLYCHSYYFANFGSDAEAAAAVLGEIIKNVHGEDPASIGSRSIYCNGEKIRKEKPIAPTPKQTSPTPKPTPPQSTFYKPAPVVYNKPWYKKLWGQWLLGAIAYALMHFLVGWP